MTVNEKFDICAGYILSWITILIILSGDYQENKPASDVIYAKPPRGSGILYSKNAMPMPRNAFEFMQPNIHLIDNSLRKP